MVGADRAPERESGFTAEAQIPCLGIDPASARSRVCPMVVRRETGEAGGTFLRVNRPIGTSLVSSPTWRGDGKRVRTKSLGDEAKDTAQGDYFARRY